MKTKNFVALALSLICGCATMGYEPEPTTAAITTTTLTPASGSPGPSTTWSLTGSQVSFRGEWLVDLPFPVGQTIPTLAVTARDNAPSCSTCLDGDGIRIRIISTIGTTSTTLVDTFTCGCGIEGTVSIAAPASHIVVSGERLQLVADTYTFFLSASTKQDLLVSISPGLVQPSVGSCLPGFPEYAAQFGTGADGNFTVPPGGFVATRDMNWNNLTFVAGSGAIDPNGYTLHVSGTLSGTVGSVGIIRRNGANASGTTPGAGLTGGGGSGSGGTAGNRGTSAGTGKWWPNLHAGAGGGGAGWPIVPTIVLTDNLAFLAAMQTFDGFPVAGGGGGYGGSFGAGGAGGGNVAVLARQIVNPANLLIESRGGAGAGDGSGGGGGLVVLVVGEGSPTIAVDVSGGAGASFSAVAGANGIALAFCVSSTPMSVDAIFGDGRDGDFTVPLGTTTVLTRDMYWRNLIWQPGATSIIDPNGFVIHVSGTMVGPGVLDAFGNHIAFISRDGRNASGTTPGSGYLCNGTLNGGSGTGGFPSSGHGNATLPNTGGLFSNIWPDTWHPEQAGHGGLGQDDALSGSGTSPTILSPSAGSLDLLAAIRLRLVTNDLTPFMGGAGGGSGGGIADGTGGGGGGGGGNIVVIAREVQDASTIEISSRGGNGGQGTIGLGGGGGGGSGGYVTIVTYRQPQPYIVVQGGFGGAAGDPTAQPGQPGGNGIVLPFRLVL